jgi:heterodisulfide reductase subunit C
MTQNKESKAEKVDVTVKTSGEGGVDGQATSARQAAKGVGGLSEGNPYAAIAGSALGERPAKQNELLEAIRNDPRMHDHLDGFDSCIQCGVCTSGCPAARFTDYSPREMARRCLDGDETLLTDDDIWYCYYCYTCQSRCPRHNSVAVLNQVVRGLQVERGYGKKHVAMFAAWGEQYYDKGMGGTPQVFFQDIAEMCGPKWKAFVARRDDLREELGLGTAYPSEKAAQELRVIMDETGFKDRLESIGAWGGHRPDDEE